MLNINTNNYNIKYNNIFYDYTNYTNNYLITEIYRNTLYIKFKKYISKIRKTIIDTHNITNLDKNNFISEIFLYDIVSIFIINHKFKSLFDPIFDISSPFKLNNIVLYFKNKCIPTINKNIQKSIKNILPKISNKYIKYYKKLKKNIIKFNDIKYNITYEINNNIVIIYFNILESNNDIQLFINKLKYKKIINISLHIFNHLVNLYNNKILNKYNNNEILDIKVIEYIYMIFIRYNTLSSGNNQASILPSFKKIIKDVLNIKIELFGSPLNTSSSTFGSLFYDIDNVFGSIGNYFNSNLLKGYYEINPIFDKCIIDKIIIKCFNELNVATINKNPLLFLFILPISYNKYSSKLNILSNFKKFEIIIEKKSFPYIRYDRQFLKTKVSPIVDTHILIYHNDFIKDIIKKNVLNFNHYINSWQLKKKY